MEKKYERNSIVRGRKNSSLLSRLNKYSLLQYKKYSPPYMAVAFAICLSYMIPYFSSREADCEILWVVRLISASLCVSIILKELWNRWWTLNFHLFWHFTLFYCLAFVSPLVLIMNGGGTIYMINICVSIIMISYFVDKKAFIWLNIVGLFLAFFVAIYLPSYIPLDLENMFYMGYTYAVSFAVSLLFSKKNIESNTERED